jgi:hypothetical protein
VDCMKRTLHRMQQAGPGPDQVEGLEPRSAPRAGEGLWIVGLLCLALLLGVWLARDFGVSTDEPDNVRVGMDARDAYRGGDAYFSREALAEHGPIYFMFFTATSEAIRHAFPSWPLYAGRHLTNYATFLLGVAFLYMLCLRFLGQPYALAASALYFTQPILFGSAFINQKDIPFLTCFLGAVALGWAAAEGRWGKMDPAAPATGKDARGRLRQRLSGVTQAWSSMKPLSRWTLGLGWLVGLGILVDLIWGDALQRGAQAIVTAAYWGRAPRPLQLLFQAVATDVHKSPIEAYLTKLQTGFRYARLLAPALFLGFTCVVGWLALPGFGGERPSRWRWEQAVALMGSAVLLGAAISVRQIGLFAGVLVTLSLFYRARGKSILRIVLYWALAGCVVYATWPYLWSDPIGRSLASFDVIRDFSAHHVLFEGVRYRAGEAPWTFVPTLIGYQLTEPALLLSVIGLAVLAQGVLSGRFDDVESALLALWLLLPSAWVVFGKVPIYNNLRHMYFVLPPIFVMGGVGLEALAVRLRSVWARRILLVSVALPGLIALVSLHPYQYAYFNSLAGGTGGAYGRFELDYWCTSLRETTEFVNQVATPGDSLMIFGPIGNTIPFVRTDLELESQYSPLRKADFAALCMFEVSRRWDPSQFQLMYQARRGGAVVGEVWRRVEVEGNDEVLPSG